MRVLWLCNIMLPVIAAHLGVEASNKEGWLSGTYERLRRADFSLTAGEKLELGICFPVSDPTGELELCVEGVQAYGFYEDMEHGEVYDQALEQRLSRIVDKFQPDMVHCFGAEFPHTLAMARVYPRPDRLLIGIQGITSEIAKVYMAKLPEKVQRSRTFRDWLKQDSIRQQQEKFMKRGAYEREAMFRAGHVTGRSDWDRSFAEGLADEHQNQWSGKYHFMNETLRSNFYQGQWKAEQCEPYTIFMSQGDYPLKGLHLVLEAMPQILERYPLTKVYIAGSDIIKNKTIMEKIKLSGYGRYLRQMMKSCGLEGKVHFLGRLSAEQMKAQYLKSGLYICPSVLENSPNSLGEAMLLGMPCAAADTGGIPTLFADGQDGLLFEKGNPEAIAEAVLNLFDHPEQAVQYGLQAREHARRTHDPDRNYERLLEIYREIVTK